MSPCLFSKVIKHSVFTVFFGAKVEATAITGEGGLNDK